jgi:hypothetical protein
MEFAPKVVQMNNTGYLAIKTIKLIWRFGLIALNAALDIGFDKPTRSPYTAIKAHNLHEDGLISDAAYTRSVHGDY